MSGRGVYTSAMSDNAYSPELIELMSTAFDAAYDQVFGEPSQAFQLQLATRIMAAVNAGERDLDRLVGVALGEVELNRGGTRKPRGGDAASCSGAGAIAETAMARTGMVLSAAMRSAS